MKKVAALALVMCFATSASAGTVIFDVIGTNVVQAGETVQFNVSILPGNIGTYDSAGAVIGADELSVDSFVYAQSWLDINAFPPPAPDYTFTYNSDLFVGGFFNEPIQGGLVGTLTVGTTGLAPGLYDVGVDSAFDFDFSAITLGTASESLSGVGRVQVVPEPATLVLLGIGGIAAMRRRRR